MIAVGTGTWGIAAVIPKYLSLRLQKRNKIDAQTTVSTSVAPNTVSRASAKPAAGFTG